MFGPDPKDEVIQYLREEVAYLRLKLDEQEKANLALMSAHTYRMRYGTAEPQAPPIDPEKIADVTVLRGVPLKPEFTLEDVKKQFRPPD